MRGEQAIFNLEIKKKSGLSINPDIHHSKVFSSGETKSSNSESKPAERVKEKKRNPEACKWNPRRKNQQGRFQPIRIPKNRCLSRRNT